MPDLRIHPNLVIPEEELQWSFVRSSGPGGQNVNKISSKAVLRWQPDPARLPPDVWRRLRAIGKRYWTSDGAVVIQCQVHRSQHQNKAECVRRLADLVARAFVPPKRRIPTRPTAASRRRRLEQKRRLSEKKRARQTRDFD